MARIILWAKRDNEHPDPLVNGQKYKVGMAVDVLEDGQHAGTEVEKGDWWRIVEVPGEPAARFANLLLRDPKEPDQLGVEIIGPKIPRRRVNRVDLDALETLAGLKPREQPEQKITLAARADVTSRVTQFTAHDDPRWIGPDPRRIG